MKLLIDMNLSPDWVEILARQGWSAVHWATIGDPRATDSELMAWATANQYIVFTHDLDFGMLLALTQASGPSVLQVRVQNVLPSYLEKLVITALKSYQDVLLSGALVMIDEAKSRVRILPFQRYKETP